MASYSKAVTGTAVMARSANEEKKKTQRLPFANTHPARDPRAGWELFCDVIIIHGKPINSCICYQDRMETLCLDVPLLDPTGDFSGRRAPTSFLPVKDVWITYYWFLRQTSHITRLNGFNDRGSREPDIKNVHHIDGSKPFLEACKQPFLFGFPGFFPRPFGRLSSVLQITFTNPLAARLSSIDLLGRCLEAELSISL